MTDTIVQNQNCDDRFGKRKCNLEKNLACVQPSISAAPYSSSEMFDLKKVLATIMLYTLKHPGRISAPDRVQHLQSLNNQIGRDQTAAEEHGDQVKMVIGFFPEKLLLESAYDVGSVTIRLTMTPQKVMIRGV